MTWTAAGSVISSTTSTFTLVPGGTGDLILVEVINISNATVFATALSSSNVTWSAFGSSFAGSTIGFTSQVFAGKVTSTSSATVTVTWSGTAPTMRIAGQEFSTTLGSWTLDTQGHVDSSGTATWASLTPASSGELYWGYSIDSTTAAAGSTPGYVYEADANGNGVAYDLSCTGGTPTAPVWGDSGQIFGIMILVKETSSAAGPPLNQGQLPNHPAIIVSGAGWRGAGRSR